MKRIIMYSLIFIILSLLVWTYFKWYLKKNIVLIQLEQVVDVQLKNGILPSHDIYYDKEQLIHPNTVSDLLKSKSDTMKILKWNLNFAKYDYIISYGHPIKQIYSGPNIKDEVSSMGGIPVEVELVNGKMKNTMYIYQIIGPKNTYRILL